MSAILDGIRNGRAFVDLTSSHDKVVDIEARDTTANNDSWTTMGGTVKAASGDSIAFRIHLSACPHATIHLFLDGHQTPALPPLSSSSDADTLPFAWTSDGGRHWIRDEVRDANGGLMLVSNPIYINFT